MFSRDPFSDHMHYTHYLITENLIDVLIDVSSHDVWHLS